MSWLVLVPLGSALAAAPSGHVDVADGTHIAGWASDGDITGPIAVHIYVDGVEAKKKLVSPPGASPDAQKRPWCTQSLFRGSVVPFGILRPTSLRLPELQRQQTHRVQKLLSRRASSV